MKIHRTNGVNFVMLGTVVFFVYVVSRLAMPYQIYGPSVTLSFVGALAFALWAIGSYILRWPLWLKLALVAGCIVHLVVAAAV